MGVRVDEAWRDQGTVQADDVVDSIRQCVVVRADPGDPSVQHHERLGRTVDPCVHNTAAVDRPHGATVAQRGPEATPAPWQTGTLRTALRYGRTVRTVYRGGVVHARVDGPAQALMVLDGRIAWIGSDDDAPTDGVDDV